MSPSHALLRIELRDYWHCGSGLGRGQMLDAVCVRDAHGLPYVPGRTVKGLLRHALTAVSAYRQSDPDLVEKLFGTDGFAQGVSRSDTQAGRLRVSSANLPEEIAGKFRALGTDAERREHAAPLFGTLRMTAIDGTTDAAKDKTLRAIEVAVPLVLHARIGAATGAPRDWFERLQTAAPLIRAVGAHKSRGLGRASCTLHPETRGGA